MSSKTHQVFVHSGTGQRYWWSESERCWVFENGARVQGNPPSGTSASRGQVLSPPSGDASLRRPNPSPSTPPNDRTTPRYIRPQQPDLRTTTLAAASGHRAAPPIPSASAPGTPSTGTAFVPPTSPPTSTTPVPQVQWRIWRESQPFGRGSTIRIQAGPDEPPVTRAQALGSGTYAHVHKVQIDGTEDLCALKVYKSMRSMDTFRQKFENEIQNMRRVSNRHIASFYAAYIYERKNQSPEFAILMQPAAEGGTLQYVIDLARAQPSRLTDQHREIFAKAFGCLSSALEYVHERMIRHKDVKSDNILMHQGKVFLADFGSSWDGFAQGSLDTHSNDPTGHTSRYAAPEIITKDPRSAKSDIFSLAGVFYEIFCALEEDAEWFDEHYWRILDKLRRSLGQWRNTQPEVIPLMYKMLDPQPDGRPTASQLVATLSAKHFCSECCQEHEKERNRSANRSQSSVPSMSRLSIQPNTGTVAGPSVQPARRGSAPAVSMSHGPARAYASRGKTQVVEEDDSGEDDSGDSDDDSDGTK